MHRPGIEPGPTAWQAAILPLNQRCLLDTKALPKLTRGKVSRTQQKKIRDSQSVGFEPTLPEGI